MGGGVGGGVRLPGVGVGQLGRPYTRLLRLSTVRANLPSLFASLPRVLRDVTVCESTPEISQEVGEALDAIVREAASFAPASQHPIQVVLVTWERVEVLTEALSMVLTLEHARHISAVHVAAVESLDGALGDGELPAGDAVGGVWVTGAYYPPDPYSFTALFKSWLLEMKGKEPHLHLILVVLDMQEVMIDPSTLPSSVSSRLTLHTHPCRIVCTTQGNSVPVYHLEVIKRVQVSSVAPYVYGAALYLLPSSAASLNFTAIWENRQLVRSLCQSLEEEEEGLLARVAAPEGTLTPHVVVLPAPHCSALSLVHVAPSDLMLPERYCPDANQALPDKLVQEVSGWLSSLPRTDLRHEDLTCPLSYALAAHFHAHTRPAAKGNNTQRHTTTTTTTTTNNNNNKSYVFSLPRPDPPRHPAHQPPSRPRGGRGRSQFLSTKALRHHALGSKAPGHHASKTPGLKAPIKAPEFQGQGSYAPSLQAPGLPGSASLSSLSDGRGESAPWIAPGRPPLPAAGVTVTSCTDPLEQDGPLVLHRRKVLLGVLQSHVRPLGCRLPGLHQALVAGDLRWLDLPCVTPLCDP
ncbi:uncharacterized protein LOC123499951 [Portunus trituberculatus]|uniref:uncharacterized protein LOC123499951 n=1 Tax=Portunus trituberculatus TaxID=210409 RepID=UPI001E1CED2A|nr:uncharacterized protein LOC123499951 [Portunus trituberculatus]